MIELILTCREVCHRSYQWETLLTLFEKRHSAKIHQRLNKY